MNFGQALLRVELGHSKGRSFGHLGIATTLALCVVWFISVLVNVVVSSCWNDMIVVTVVSNNIHHGS